jgi:microcystin degradation protein MlrC
VQRALVWEAREPDTYVNIFFGFPFADVPDVGMTVQVLTNGNPELAGQIGRDLAGAIWRQREALLKSAKIHSITDGVALAKLAVAKRDTPVVLADHSDRSGSATWLLREIMAQDLANTLIATISDSAVTAKLKAAGAKEGDALDMDVGGLTDESAGEPVRIQGTILKAVEGYGQFWVCIRFGRNNVLILSTYLVQIMEPFSLKVLGLDIGSFDVMAIKSRVHFRRGFDDNGFAKTILLVEPAEPFLGTTHLDKLPYENVDLTRYYPYGSPASPV